MNKATYFLLALVVLVMFCSPAQEAARQLPTALQEFNEALAWKHHQAAEAFVAPDSMQEIAQRLRRVTEQYDILEVEPLGTALSADGESALCVVKFSWYDPADLTVRKGTEVQEWRSINGDWFIVAQRPPADGTGPASPFATLPKPKLDNSLPRP